MRTTLILLSIALMLACGGEPKANKSGDESQASAADKTGKNHEAQAKAADRSIELEKFGLKVDVPAGVRASDAVVGEGMMIKGPGLVLTVEISTDATPKTLGDAKQEADIYTPQNIQEETLEDGWTLTFENKGGMGTNYWVQSRREIDGTSYWCSTTAAQVEQQAHALAACKSLRK